MNARRSKARSVADLSEGVVLATVEIAAAPDRVFRALASSEVAQWWGEEGMYRTTEWAGDVRVGGKWRSVGVGADGKPFSVDGEFVEVDAPRKLVHTWKPDWVPGPATTVSYRLDAIEGGTRLTLRHSGFTSPESCASHGDGWTRVLGWLTGFVEGTRAPKKYFLLRLLAPRPTFAQDMSEAERKVMGEHAMYWRKLLAEGYAVAFGPVADPKGAWGAAVVELDDPGRIAGFTANDPAILSELGFRYEVLPMLSAVTRPA